VLAPEATHQGPADGRNLAPPRRSASFSASARLVFDAAKPGGSATAGTLDSAATEIRSVIDPQEIRQLAEVGRQVPEPWGQVNRVGLVSARLEMPRSSR
jgi:hypothetical protein